MAAGFEKKYFSGQLAKLELNPASSKKSERAYQKSYQNRNVI